MKNLVCLGLFLIVFFVGLCCTLPEIAHCQTKKFNDINKDAVLASPGVIAKTYLGWYVANKARLDRIAIFAPDTASDTTYYKVNFKRVDYYLRQIKKSGYVSNTYIDTLKFNYMKADKNLRSQPQNDGPIKGFEVDPILGIMEESEITDHSNMLKIQKVIVKTNKAIVYGRLLYNLRIKFELSQIDGIWMVDCMKPYYIHR